VQVRFNQRRRRWEVDFGFVLDGGSKKRLRRYYETRRLAEQAAAEFKASASHGGKRVLTGAIAGRVIDALQRLDAAGVSLEDAVTWAVERRRPTRSIWLQDAVQKWLDDADGRGLAKATLRKCRSVLLKFQRGRENADVSTLTTQEIEQWMRGAGGSPATKSTYLAVLASFFNWGMKIGHCIENPCAGAAKAQAQPAEEISCMTPAQAFVLLDTARKHYPEMLGFVSMGLFCGVRVAELSQMQANAVDLDQRVAIVGAAAAKARARRVVIISDNAAAWMKHWKRGDEGSLAPHNLIDRWQRLRIRAGWDLPWPRNLMRHTFASMHYAMHSNEQLLQAQMGHRGGGEILHQHYRAVRMLDGRLISPNVAADFWALSPPDGPDGG